MIYRGLWEEAPAPEVVVIPRDRRGVLPAYVNGVPDLRMSGDGTYVNPRVRDADTLREQTEVPLPERNALHWAAEEARLKQQREQAEPMPDTLMDFLDAVEHIPGEQAYILRMKQEHGKHWKAEYDFWESIKRDRAVMLALKVIATRERVTKSPRFLAIRAKIGSNSK